jgi:hypothetical protein
MRAWLTGTVIGALNPGTVMAAQPPGTEIGRGTIQKNSQKIVT